MSIVWIDLEDKDNLELVRMHEMVGFVNAVLNDSDINTFANDRMTSIIKGMNDVRYAYNLVRKCVMDEMNNNHGYEFYNMLLKGREVNFLPIFDTKRENVFVAWYADEFIENEEEKVITDFISSQLYTIEGNEPKHDFKKPCGDQILRDMEGMDYIWNVYSCDEWAIDREEECTAHAFEDNLREHEGKTMGEVIGDCLIECQQKGYKDVTTRFEEDDYCVIYLNEKDGKTHLYEVYKEIV